MTFLDWLFAVNMIPLRCIQVATCNNSSCFFFFPPLSILWKGYTTTNWINIYQLKDIVCSLCLNMNKASSVQDFVWLYMFHFSKISAKECDCWILCKCMFSRLPKCFIRVLYSSKPTSNVWEIEFLCIPAKIMKLVLVLAVLICV